MPITIGSPPARPTLKVFDPTRVSFSAGLVTVDVDVKNSGTLLQTHALMVRLGEVTGLRYVSATGELESFTIVDATVTVIAARNAYENAAGLFAAKADALLTYIQGKGGLPT